MDVNEKNVYGMTALMYAAWRDVPSIAIPTAACGIIINVVTGQTSLATNLSNLISASSNIACVSAVRLASMPSRRAMPC